MHNFKKVVSPGRARSLGQIVFQVEYKQSTLSITGKEGPKWGGDCVGAAGQIYGNRTAWEFYEWNEGWTPEKLDLFVAYWRRWHLNDMHPGSPLQTDFLELVGCDESGDWYDNRCKALAAAGLNPDPFYLRDGQPYEYGRAWLRQEVPEHVLQWLTSLPDHHDGPACRKPNSKIHHDLKRN